MSLKNSSGDYDALYKGEIEKIIIFNIIQISGGYWRRGSREKQRHFRFH